MSKITGPPGPCVERGGTRPTGWWMSEKLDGVRAYWDGKQFLSRNNNIFYAPSGLRKGFHPILSMASCGWPARNSTSPAVWFASKANRTTGSKFGM